MNGVRACLFAVTAVLISAIPSAGQDLTVNGYTYIAPSVYPTPPVVVYDPAFVVPTRTVIYAEPAFVTQTVMPYNPTWAYAPVTVGPTAVRERVRYSRNGLEYKYQAYVPGRAAPVYTYRIDSERRGVKIRERYR